MVKDNAVKKVLKEITHNIIDENKDSLELGSATKGGKIKIYGDFNDTKKFKDKIDKAIEVRKYANMELDL
jgi:hypothetical protein